MCQLYVKLHKCNMWQQDDDEFGLSLFFTTNQKITNRQRWQALNSLLSSSITIEKRKQSDNDEPLLLSSTPYGENTRRWQWTIGLLMSFVAS